MADKDIEKLLKGSDQPAEYPKDKWTATRAEFTTRVRMNQPKKGGCGKSTGMVVLLIVLIVILVVML